MNADERCCVFTRDDLAKPHGDTVIKKHFKSGRTISHTFMPRVGHFLSVAGSDVPGTMLTISCSAEHLQVLARLLLDATFDPHLFDADEPPTVASSRDVH